MKMNHFTLLPSANWNISHMLAVNDTGKVCAYGSRGDILIIYNADQDDFSALDTRIIGSAHKNARVMGLAFVSCEIKGRMMELLASCGDDGRLKIWDYEQGIATHKTILKDKENLANPMKFVDIDYFSSSHCIVCIAEQGYIVKWDLMQNKIWTFSASVKSPLSCVAVCPHADDLIAIGTRFGRVIVFSVKGEGKLIHRLLCHNTDVTSVSWCPVPYNVLQLSRFSGENSEVEEFKNTDKTFLLASCCSDLTIYVSRAGTDNHCETLIKLPTKPLSNSGSRYTLKRNPNMEHGRVLKWIYPFVIVTFTNFNEMVSLYLSKFDNKSSVLKEEQSSTSMKITHLKCDVKNLHNAHKRNINSFAVCLFNRDEVDFRVWSYSSDKILVRSGFRKNYREKPMVLPLLSGFIFCLDISCINPDLLAIGSGDGKISVWNLSTDHFIDIKTLSKKIDHKVMSVSWHPHYEGIFAFGTYEGRVGLFDVSQGGYSPTLFKTFHQKAVYRLCWAPPLYVNVSSVESETKPKHCDHLFLLAVVDGDVLQYNPKTMDELPVSLSQTVFYKHDKKCESCVGNKDKLCYCKNKSDMCFENNRDVIVIGYKAGEIRFFSATSFELLHVLNDQTKTIMSVSWHPQTVFDSPNQVSPYRNWLAVAGEKVLVYNVVGEELPKKIATFEIHTSRILHVAWSPHSNGRLVSCSGDCTAIVWDVINQAIIGRYTKHTAQVLCGIWSRTNKDVIITGSSDFTCRMWSISKDTVSAVQETKKNILAIEPSIVNFSKVAENAEKLSTTKVAKSQTLFPSIAQGFHHSLLLDEIIERAISKHDPNYMITMNEKCIKHNSSIQNDSLTSLEDSLAALEVEQNGSPAANRLKSDSLEKNNKALAEKPLPSTYNYDQLFGSKDELINLICQEERFLEESGSNVYLILVQARDALKKEIIEAIDKNKVTNYHIALAASVSPKLYKDACQVYIEQMIHADNVLEAVNFQLALGLDLEAISLLCDKKRFREAFALARLRLDDESVIEEVLRKWINFCNACGSYRLGSHCYMYLNEEEKACLLLSKSKSFKDAFLAAKLLKFYQPKRATELATHCIRKNLSIFSSQNIEEVFKFFPELKFFKPWYISLKYFTEEKPNTASITKWVIGLLKDTNNFFEDLITCFEDIDFEKLQSAVIDTAFQMNSDELSLHVSAQAALYVIGSTNLNHATCALRHFIRALSQCYNFRLVHSNQIYSDKAYPMMRLLKLMFPNGVLKKCESNDFDHNSPLHKSINAYVCDFVVTWLTACNDLPKSLKYSNRFAKSPDGIVNESKIDVEKPDKDEEISANYNDDIEMKDDIDVLMDIIVDRKTKLEKIILLLENCLNDLLDVDTVAYFKNVSKLKKCDSGAGAMVNGNVDPFLANGTDSKLREGLATLKGSEGNNLYPCGESLLPSKLLDQNSFESCDNLSLQLADALDVDCDKNEINNLREKVEKFERERLSAPNPFIFICTLKNFLANQKQQEPGLVLKVESMVERAVEESGLMVN